MNHSPESGVLDVLDRFCSAFAKRDAEAVMELVAADGDLIVVTSEEPLLRGPGELREFVEGYARGLTTYSWEWDRHRATVSGDLAWLLAEGTETVATGDRQERHPYRMTMVMERREGRWLLRQVHGSSPHRG